MLYLVHLTTMNDVKNIGRYVAGSALLIFVLLITFTNAADTGFPAKPLILPFLIIFWLGVFSWISPNFFLKYKYALYFTYVLNISYISYTIVYGEHGLLFNIVALPIPLFLIVWFFERWKWIRTIETEKKEAELAMLKSQVDPHFFFNTLNNLHSLVLTQSSEASDVILKLSEMMRYTIYEGKNDFVWLRDEVKYLQNYIDLHKIRYKNDTEIEFTHCIEENTKVAPLLFIIFLENAFKHGIESLPTSAYIRMELKSTADLIQFNLENNFKPVEINSENGIGIENLKKRLLLIYPDKHDLIINEEEDRFLVNLKIKLK